MGRYKKTKTIIEENEYLLRRRLQNRINQMNYRRRRKIVNSLKDKTIRPTQTKMEYLNELSQLLKGFDFDYYITLTNREISSIKSLFHLIPNFIKQLKNQIKFGYVFYVIERGLTDHPHIHLLVKSQSSLNKLKTIIKNKWKKGFIDIQRIYSVFDDYTLEKYVMKEVSILSNDELMWDFV
jgi:uncharacterized protein YajQ (UPF0234 family)